jgi:hypothetical protein
VRRSVSQGRARLSGAGYKLRKLFRIIRSGDVRFIYESVRRWVYSDAHALGLRIDLTRPSRPPPARLNLKVRPIEERDFPVFTNVDVPGLSREEVSLRTSAAALLRSDLQTCYVAVTEDDTPCYLQYLIGPSENEKVRKLFGDLFPPLQEDEVLLEFMFTAEAFRGSGVGPQAMTLLKAEASKQGALWVLGFVSTSNVPALKAANWVGFEPYLIRKETYRLFRRRVTFTRLPPGTPYPPEVTRRARRVSPKKSGSLPADPRPESGEPSRPRRPRRTTGESRAEPNP